MIITGNLRADAKRLAHALVRSAEVDSVNLLAEKLARASDGARTADTVFACLCVATLAIQASIGVDQLEAEDILAEILDIGTEMAE